MGGHAIFLEMESFKGPISPANTSEVVTSSQHGAASAESAAAEIA